MRGLSAVLAQLLQNVSRQEIHDKLQERAAAYPGSERVETPFGPYEMTSIEARLYRAMTARGLNPVPQFNVGRFYPDFAFPDLKTAVEADGKDYHSGERKARDEERDRLLQHDGWTVLRFSGSEIYRDADTCARIVAQKLEAAGGHRRDPSSLAILIAVAGVVGAMLLTVLLRSLGS